MGRVPDRAGEGGKAGNGYAWGWVGTPEDNLGVLGDVTGADVLELGCGSADGALRLARMGARVVGLDGSAAQLDYGQRAVAISGQTPPLVHADAERLPFADACFDIAVSNWGALSHCEPVVAVPEASRVLRAGGLLVLCSASPLYWLCTDNRDEGPSAALRHSYFDLDRRTLASGMIEFQPPAEPPIPSHLDEATWRAWITRWPFDCIWKARKVIDDPVQLRPAES